MSFHDKSISRRNAVPYLGATVAGVAVAAAVPTVNAQTSVGSTVAPFTDPTTKYPKPPYPSQSQPWPGLASKMTPRPDHWRDLKLQRLRPSQWT